MSNTITCCYVILVIMIFSGIYTSFMGYRTYTLKYNELFSKKTAADALHLEICSNPAQKEKYDMWKQCEENRILLETTPDKGATYAVLDSWHLCNIGLCGGIMRSVAERLQTLFIVVVLGYFILCYFFGRWLGIKQQEEKFSKYSGLGGYPPDRNYKQKKTE